MRVGLLVVGIACLAVGGYSVIWRERVVARLRSRPRARTVQSPAAYLVMGTIIGLAGAGLVIDAFR